MEKLSLDVRTNCSVFTAKALILYINSWVFDIKNTLLRGNFAVALQL